MSYLNLVAVRYYESELQAPYTSFQAKALSALLSPFCLAIYLTRILNLYVLMFYLSFVFRSLTYKLNSLERDELISCNNPVTILLWQSRILDHQINMANFVTLKYVLNIIVHIDPDLDLTFTIKRAFLNLNKSVINKLLKYTHHLLY